MEMEKERKRLIDYCKKKEGRKGKKIQNVGRLETTEKTNPTPILSIFN